MYHVSSEGGPLPNRAPTKRTDFKARVPFRNKQTPPDLRGVFQSHTADRTLFVLFCFSMSHYPSSPSPFEVFTHSLAIWVSSGILQWFAAYLTTEQDPKKKKITMVWTQSFSLSATCSPLSNMFVWGPSCFRDPSLALIPMAWLVWPNGTD